MKNDLNESSWNKSPRKEGGYYKEDSLPDIQMAEFVRSYEYGLMTGLGNL